MYIGLCVVLAAIFYCYFLDLQWEDVILPNDYTTKTHHLLRRRLSSMAWYCTGSNNAELVNNLFNSGLIKSERVKNAMLGVS